MRFRMLHGRRGSVRHIVREVNQELGQTALGRRVVAEDRGERGVSKGLGETLA